MGKRKAGNAAKFESQSRLKISERLLEILRTEGVQATGNTPQQQT